MLLCLVQEQVEFPKFLVQLLQVVERGFPVESVVLLEELSSVYADSSKYNRVFMRARYDLHRADPFSCPDSFGFYVLDKDGLVFGNNCEPIRDIPE